MNVLLSIRPKYATKIVEGKKKYEFRKKIFKKRGIKQIYIYSTAPVSKIIGTMNVDEILEGTAKEIWEKCSLHAGMTEEEFFYYFGDRTKAFAIKIKNVEVFDKPIDPSIVFDVFTPPQSFCYLEENPMILKDKVKRIRVRPSRPLLFRILRKRKDFHRRGHMSRKRKTLIHLGLIRKRKTLHRKTFSHKKHHIQRTSLRRKKTGSDLSSCYSTLTFLS